MAGDGPHGLSAFGEHFIAGQLAMLSELVLWHAPNINSYKRYVPGSFAPTAVRWGVDNRTCAMRLVGHGAGLRVENRVPGGDVNPYLAVAAMIAAGLHGVDRELPLEEAFDGERLHGRGQPGARPRCATRWSCGSRVSWPVRRSATTSSSTTPTRPGWRSRRSTPRSPTGNCSRGFERM